MPIPTFTGLGPDPQYEDIVNKVNTLVAELRNLMLTLDSLNVVSLTADHVDTGTLNANLVTIRSDLLGTSYLQLDGNGIRANNGLIDTFEIDTDGNAYFRGNITSDAIITGALIRTATSGRRLTLIGNEFIAYDANGTRRIAYEILDSVGTNDYYYGIKWYGADGLEKMQMQSNDTGFFMGGGAFGINADILMQGGSFDFGAVNVYGLITNTISDHDHGVTSGRYLKTYDSGGVELGLQLWSASGGHSHTVTT